MWRWTTKVLAGLLVVDEMLLVITRFRALSVFLAQLQTHTTVSSLMPSSSRSHASPRHTSLWRSCKLSTESSMVQQQQQQSGPSLTRSILVLLLDTPTEAGDNTALYQVLCVVRYWLRNWFHQLPKPVRMEILPLCRSLVAAAVAGAVASTPPLQVCMQLEPCA